MTPLSETEQEQALAQGKWSFLMMNLQSIMEFNLPMVTFQLFKISQWLCPLCKTSTGSTLWETWQGNMVSHSQLVQLEEPLLWNLLIKVCHLSLLRTSTQLATMSWSKIGCWAPSLRTRALCALNQSWKVSWKLQKRRFKRQGLWLLKLSQKKKLWIQKQVLLD